MIAPVIDALTTPTRPRRRAVIAMIISAALPNVAFSRPPTPAPVRSASRSVVRPSHAASGMIARQAATKIATCLSGASHSSATAAGRKASSQSMRGRRLTERASDLA